jgi:hypothetical protein
MNAGWFQRGDGRINREGRPRGSKSAAPEGSTPADRAPRADRLKLLFVPGLEFAFRLCHPKGFWVTNLPPDFEIVSCRLDPARQGVVLTIRSRTFPRIARDALIPEFAPRFEGRKWTRN